MYTRRRLGKEYNNIYLYYIRTANNRRILLYISIRLYNIYKIYNNNMIIDRLYVTLLQYGL